MISTLTGTTHMGSAEMQDLPPISDPGRFRHAWYLIGPNQFILNTNALMGPLAPNKVRIQLLYNGHCESDKNVARLGKHPSQKHREPETLLGHEPVGRVIAIGEGVTNLSVGKIVAIEPGISCGECRACHAGLYNICTNVKYLATPANAKKDGEAAWTEGSYCTSMDWSARLCHEIPDGGNAMLSSLAESVAACREARKEMVDCTHDFRPDEEYALIIGAGQMAIGLLMQLLRKYESLEIILMARKESDRRFAEGLGAGRVKTVPLPAGEWQDVDAEREAAEAAFDEGEDQGSIFQRHSRISKMKKANAGLQDLLAASFQQAKGIGQGAIASVFETTGQPHLLQAASRARVIRAKGSYGLISCLYGVRYDEADLRRDGARTFRLRRSANQFPEAIRDINRHPELYNQTVGRIVDFRDIPKLYDEETAATVGHRIGDGPKVVIKY